MTELKPCPFCGSEKLVFGHEEDGSCCIGCANCGVRVGHYCEYMSDNEDIAGLWNRRAEEERNTHIEHTVNISTGSITKEELDRYLWECSTDILPYILHDDTPEISFDEVLDMKIKEAVKKCLEEYYGEEEEKE